MRGKWWDFSGNWLDWLEASQRWTRWRRQNGAFSLREIKDIPSSFRERGARRAQRDGRDGRTGPEREEEERGWKENFRQLKSLREGRRSHSLSVFFFKIECVGVKCAHNNCLITCFPSGSQLSSTDTDSFPPTHVLYSLAQNITVLSLTNLHHTRVYTTLLFTSLSLSVSLSPSVCFSHAPPSLYLTERPSLS